jgi:hypothetical protein
LGSSYPGRYCQATCALYPCASGYVIDNSASITYTQENCCQTTTTTTTTTSATNTTSTTNTTRTTTTTTSLFATRVKIVITLVCFVVLGKALSVSLQNALDRKMELDKSWWSKLTSFKKLLGVIDFLSVFA